MQIVNWLHPSRFLDLGSHITTTEPQAGSRVWFSNGYGVSWYLRNPRQRDDEKTFVGAMNISICVVKGTEEKHDLVTDDITIDADELGSFLALVSNPFFKYYCDTKHYEK